MTPRDALYVASFGCFVLFLLIGRVSRRPVGRLDAGALYFRAQAIPLARIFTKSGRSPALALGYVIAFAVYVFARLPVWIPIVLAASQIASQITVEFFKRIYKRIRPDYWLVRLDVGHSYPSGHATTAVISFSGWALVIAAGALSFPVKCVLVAILLFWAVGIAWSRLALGAHYLTDVAGGVLFGIAWLCALIAVLLAYVPFWPPA